MLKNSEPETAQMDVIRTVPGLCGEEPTIRGMRITVRDIVEYVELYGSRERVLKALPDLTEADVDAAMAYYRAHREEIDRYRIEEALSDVSPPPDKA